MVIMSILCLPAAIWSFILAARAQDSKFWSIGASSYGFNAGALAYGSLIAIGIVSLLLSGSGFLITD